MTTRNFTDLHTAFSNQSRDIWERLSYVKDSYKTRGPLGPVRFGEETITDLIMMDLYMKGSTLVHFTQTAKPDEALWGTDFELWLGSDQLGWFRFAIQAKKLALTDDRYSSLTQGNSNGDQIDLLEQYGRLNRAAPLYCLYNFTEYADQYRHYHCGDGQHELKELGCTVTPSPNIRMAINTRGAKNFNTIHSKKNTLPWRCLVSCPLVQQSLVALAAGITDAPVLDVFPLFDPRSCYHRVLPMAIRGDGGGVSVRENESGGALMSIRLDAERDILIPGTQADPPVRSDFRERYHPEAGVPKAAAVLVVEGPTQAG